MAGDPVVTVVTPSFNQGQYLEATLRSVLDQDYPKAEYVVMDGGSTDRSVEIIRKFDDRLAYWQSKPDRGQPAAINEGFRRGRGEYLTFVNSDDLLEPGALSAGIRELEATGADVCYGDHYRIDARGRRIERIYTIPWSSWLAARTRPYCPQPGTIFRRSAWEAVNGFDENLSCVFDTDFWLRLAERQARFVYIRRPQSSFRLHADSKGGSERWRQKYQREIDEFDLRHRSKFSRSEKLAARAILGGIQLMSGNYARRGISRLTNLTARNLNGK